MSGSRLALVAEDQRIAQALQAHLVRGVGPSAQLFTFADVRDHLNQDTDGVLVITAVTAAEVEQATQLVQDVNVLSLPPTLIVLEADHARGGSLDDLDPYVTARVRWPEDAARLTELVREHLRPGPGFGERKVEAVEEVIGRRLFGQTPSLLPLAERMALAASHDVTVLLTGETGTGKTYVARLMHDCSPRRQERFLTVPCGALAPSLVESEFFGHTRGAFTSADRPKVGKFAAAGEGTLLLDEIDALGLEQQANLLRVIETGEYEPVGSNETQLCKARIIVASNWDLEEAVGRGKFRRDLYYRLNVMSFHLPPLRERVEDIGPLARGMAARFARKFRKGLFAVSPAALEALEAFPWPGNIRQLENAVQQAVLVSSGPWLLPEHLPQPVRQHVPVGHANGNGYTTGDSLAQNRETLERSVIQRTLVTCGYSRARAANALGISRVTLYKKMKKYDLMAVPLNPCQAR